MKLKLLLVFLAIASIVFVTVYGSIDSGKNRSDEQNYRTLLRVVGHRLLLSAGDPRSRVLPVRQLSDDEFQIHFETQLSLVPDSIFNIISSTTKASALPDDYTAAIRDCSNDEIVYSFVMSEIDSNVIVPCLGRQLPMGCYYVYMDFSASHGKASKTTYLFAGGALLLLLIIYLFYNFKSRSNKIARPMDTTVSLHTLAIGKFNFFFDQRYLEINGEKIELTDKESKLLYIFASSPNRIIEREQLQKEVWENEGVIVARSLDVFISRLRKKLEKDAAVRLVNAHGKGYKLEIIET